MDVSKITEKQAGTLTEVLAESPSMGPEPAALTMHSLHWTSRAGERCVESRQTAFIRPPDPPPPPPPPPRPFNCTAYWATQHNEYPHSFCALFPLFNGISCSCSNASPLLFVASYLSSSPIFICLLSLSDLQGYCMMMLQCMSIWKRWTSC